MTKNKTKTCLDGLKFQLLNLIESGDFEEACRRILEARLMLYLYDIQPVTKADKFYSDDAPDELRKKLSRIQVEQLEQGGYSDQVMTVVDCALSLRK